MTDKCHHGNLICLTSKPTKLPSQLFIFLLTTNIYLQFKVSCFTMRIFKFDFIFKVHFYDNQYIFFHPLSKSNRPMKGYIFFHRPHFLNVPPLSHLHVITLIYVSLQPQLSTSCKMLKAQV